MAIWRPYRVVALCAGEPPELVHETIGTYLESARTLGRRTAELHLSLAHAEALDAEGDHDEAREVLARAREVLLARAEAIGDPAIRESFLEAVPEHARIMARAAEWLGAPV